MGKLMGKVWCGIRGKTTTSLSQDQRWRYDQKCFRMPAMIFLTGTMGIVICAALRCHIYIVCFHMTSWPPYLCPKTMQRRPCLCPKPVQWELNSFVMQTLSFVPINLHRCWPLEWKHRIYIFFFDCKKLNISAPLRSTTWIRKTVRFILAVSAEHRRYNNTLCNIFYYIQTCGGETRTELSDSLHRILSETEARKNLPEKTPVGKKKLGMKSG